MSTSYHESEVRIHSNICDLAAHAKRDENGTLEQYGYSAVMLYYFCRGIDIRLDENGSVERKGCGKATFNLAEPSDCLGKTISTIKKYLVDGVKLGFFRSVKRSGNTVTVYYASLHSVAARYGLEGLGVFADVSMMELRHLKYWGTQLVAQHLQNASRHLAKAKLPKRETVAQPEDILNSPTHIKGHSKRKSPNAAKPRKRDEVCSEQEQSQWARNVVYRSDRYTFVDSHFIMFGVSQKHVADYQGRSASTIYRRLNNEARKWIGSDRAGTKRERGIESLPQTQLAQFVQGGVKKNHFQMLKALEVDLEKVFWSAGGIWRSGCKVYSRQFQITSGKSCKYWYRKNLESGQLGVTSEQNTNQGEHCVAP